MVELHEDLHDELHDSIIRELGNFVRSKTATFACGGAITIAGSPTDTPPKLPQEVLDKEQEHADDIVCPPISLRWDSLSELGVVSKLTFPVAQSEQEKRSDLSKLVHDGQPASFGYNGENVLDESYGKAIKLDRSTFSVDFCPYETGIIDTVAQLLLPNVHQATKGVRAELYKLNIYSASSGFFEPHVNNPRSSIQFGSLVVALPCHHEGGQLVVRHADQTITFDWSTSASQGRTVSAVQWAAFYGDCEHEVKEVTEGHRITLTYNLYYSLGVGNLTGNSPAMDATSLLLYHKVKAALEIPNFMANGGFLGIYLQHPYAHSTDEGIDALPGALKGTDMAIYTVFLALGLDISIRPVLKLDEAKIHDDDQDTGEEYSSQSDEEAMYDDDQDTEEEDSPHHDQEMICDDDQDTGEEGSPQPDLIGLQLKPVHVSNCDGVDSHEIKWTAIHKFGADWLEMNWLNSAQHPNVGLVYTSYERKVSNEYEYTYAALVVKVPPAALRVDSTSLVLRGA